MFSRKSSITQLDLNSLLTPFSLPEDCYALWKRESIQKRLQITKTSKLYIQGRWKKPYRCIHVCTQKKPQLGIFSMFSKAKENVISSEILRNFHFPIVSLLYNFLNLLWIAVFCLWLFFMLSLLICCGITLFGSLMIILEKGRWDEFLAGENIIFNFKDIRSYHLSKVEALESLSGLIYPYPWVWGSKIKPWILCFTKPKWNSILKS